MRLIRRLSAVGIGLWIALCLAPVTRAQGYSWIDEHGSMHVASDPSEIPPRFRKQAVDASENASNRVRIVPMEKPAPKTPYYKLSPEQKKQQDAIKAEIAHQDQEARDRKISEEWRERSQEERTQKQDAEREASRQEREKESEETGRTPGPEGFKPGHNCWWDYKTQRNVCNTEEENWHQEKRMDDARKKASEELGIDEDDAAKDPELAKKLEDRTIKRYLKSDRYAQPEEEDGQ
ncbi:MAG TPA: hypothetical protein VMR50_10875 [Myxococcota bacterium]|nr:hypothetical protein [Myxococcota bacterium]